jgi:hypothetical protein
MLKALAGPFPDIAFCPTGGMTPANAALPGAAQREGLRRLLADAGRRGGGRRLGAHHAAGARGVGAAALTFDASLLALWPRRPRLELAAVGTPSRWRAASMRSVLRVCCLAMVEVTVHLHRVGLVAAEGDLAAAAARRLAAAELKRIVVAAALGLSRLQRPSGSCGTSPRSACSLPRQKRMPPGAAGPMATPCLAIMPSIILRCSGGILAICSLHARHLRLQVRTAGRWSSSSSPTVPGARLLGLRGSSRTGSSKARARRRDQDTARG